MLRSSRLLPAVLFAGLVVSGCAGARPSPSGPAAPDGPAGPSYPMYETFDAAAYPVVAPPPVPEAHDVPASVMSGRVAVPGSTGSLPAEAVPTQVEGHRVQVFSTASRETADRVRGEALAWWASARGQAGAPAEMDVEVVYLQPYYRVRMGAFADRDAADAALALVRTHYPEAFLVPDLVTVRR